MYYILYILIYIIIYILCISIYLNLKPIHFSSYGNLKVIFEAAMFRHSSSSSSSFILISCGLYISKESKYN